MRPFAFLACLALVGGRAESQPVGGASDLLRAQIGVGMNHALLFGIDDYRDIDVSDLESPVHDVEKIAEVLRVQYGFARVDTLVNEQATRDNIMAELYGTRTDSVVGSAQPDDSLVIFFAGHGTKNELNQEGFWVPWDGNPHNPGRLVSNGDVHKAMEAMRVRHVLLISDSCYSGTLRGRDLRQSDEALDLHLARQLASQRSRVVISSGRDEVVRDSYRDTGHSVFSYFLLQELSSPQGPGFPAWTHAGAFFDDLRRNVVINSNQQPLMAPLPGDEGGELLFVSHLATAQLPPLGMVPVPAGTFIMGCNGADAGPGESPRHSVTITRAFELSQYEVTQAQFESVMGYNPSFFRGANRPVESVTRDEAIELVNALSQDAGLRPCYQRDARGAWTWPEGPRCEGYRLPTEAEWELAAHGGIDTVYAGSDALSTVGWYNETSGGETRPVGGLAENSLHVHDLSGNVREWVWDRYAPYPAQPVVDPVGPADGSFEVDRGGGWNNPASRQRITARGQVVPGGKAAYIGVRVARTLDTN